MAIIGKNTIGALFFSSADVAFALIHSSFIHTAIAGDAVTDLQWYGRADPNHGIAIAIYDFSAPLPGNWIAAPTTWPADGFAIGWHQILVNIPLTAGVVYCIALVSDNSARFYYDTGPGVHSSQQGIGILTNPWAQTSTSDNHRSFFATVVNTAPPAPSVIRPCCAQIIT